MYKRIPYFVLVLGIVVALVSVLADIVGLGSDGIQAAQLLGLQIGILVALVGVGLKIANQSGDRLLSWEQVLSLGERVLDLPVITWVLASFLVVYFLFFISPVFLNSKLQMAYLNRYLPHTGMIGADLRVFVEYIEEWLTSGQSPYTSGYIAYPPFSFFLFSPLVLVGYPASFRLITVITLTSYLIVTLTIPRLLATGRSFSLLLFILIVGLFSYGLQFELERGQSNLIAFAFCLIGICIFHFHKRLRIFAYILFSVSIQMKLYPAIFFMLFIEDWRDWGGNMKRIFGLALFNFTLLFVMGFTAFIDFSKAIALQQFNLSQWNGNHSIRAFAVNLTGHGFGIFSPEMLANLEQYARSIEMTLMVVVVVCIALVIIFMYRCHETGFNPYLLFACTIGALVIPSVSNDYKLSILPASVAILFSGLSVSGKPVRKVITILLVLLFSAAYWSVLYPFKVKPEILASSFPILFLMLVSSTVLYFVSGSASKQEQVNQSRNLEEKHLEIQALWQNHR